MKCQVCNAEAAPGASFCQHCGAKLSPFDAGTVQPTPGAASPAGPSAPAPAEPATGAGAALTSRRRPIADVAEETLWEGGYSPKAMLGSFVGAAVVSLLLIVSAVAAGQKWEQPFWLVPAVLLVLVWLGIASQLAHKRLGIHYKLTSQMFYHQRGVLRRTTDRVEAIDIDDVTYVQGIFDRMAGVGRIQIMSSDRTDPELWLEGIENVQDVARLIDKARRAERLRRGVSVEAV